MSVETATRVHEFDSVELIESDSINPNNSKALEQIRHSLMQPAITKVERQKARDTNKEKFDTAKSGQVNFILGATGTGKTTTFMKQYVVYYDYKETDKHVIDTHAKRKGILVVPTNAAVENAADSAIGIFKAENPKLISPEIEMNCIIFAVTEFNKKGWQGQLQSKKANEPDKAILVIVNASFFASTMSYWFNNNYDIMIDEPDDKCNPSTSPTAILAVEFFYKKNKNYQIPKQEYGSSKLKYFQMLKDYYIQMRYSYTLNETPRLDRRDEDYHIKMLKSLMQKYTGKFFLSSATMPNWLLKAVEVLELKNSIIEMEKPSNPRYGVYLEHFDNVIHRCIKEGNMSDVYSPLCEAIYHRICFLRSIETEFEKNCKGDSKMQMEGFRKILVVLPGMNEVHNFTTENLESYLTGHPLDVGQFVIMTPNNTNHVQRELEHKPNAIVVHVVPFHMGRGLNYNTASIFVGPFRRVRNEKGAVTELSVDMCDLADCNQIEGRGGRLGPCTIFRLGSKKTFESLLHSNDFYGEGMEQTIMGLVSHGLHQNHFADIASMIEKATCTNAMSIVSLLKTKKFIDVHSDGHYQQTHSGKLYNIFHDLLSWYMDIESFLKAERSISQENIFKMILWMQLYSNMTNGKNTLFNFPENKGLRSSMRESRIEIEITCGVRNIDSHFSLIWNVVNYIYITIINEFKGDMSVLFRYNTFNDRSTIGRFAFRAHLDAKTLRLCCVNALNQLYAVMDRDLLHNLPVRAWKEYTEADVCETNFSPIQEFSFNDFVTEKSMVDIASGEMTIATMIHEDHPKDNQRLYIGSDGKIYMVYYDLVTPFKDASIIVVVKSVVKPDMLKRNVALATVILPMTVLTKVNDFDRLSDLYDLLMSKFNFKIVQIIRDWLQSDSVEPPFQLIETDSQFLNLVFQNLLGEKITIYMVDPLTLQFLMSIIKMHQNEKNMTDATRKELYSYFNRMFKEHTREILSKGGASMVTRFTLPMAQIDVGGAIQPLKLEKFELDTVKSTAFIPYTLQTMKKGLASKTFGRIIVKATRMSEEELKTCVKFQQLNSMVSMESATVIDDRKSRFNCMAKHLASEDLEGFTQEKIVPRHVCPMCNKTDNHDNRISAVIVQEKHESDQGLMKLTEMNGVVMVYHTQCLLNHLNDVDFAEFCPFTGGRMFDIGINNIPMKETFEDRIHKIKRIVMTKEHGDEHIRLLLVSKFVQVNKALNTTYGDDELMQLPMDKLREIYSAYNKALEVAKADAEMAQQKLKFEARRKALDKLKEEQRIRKALKGKK